MGMNAYKRLSFNSSGPQRSQVIRYFKGAFDPFPQMLFCSLAKESGRLIILEIPFIGGACPEQIFGQRRQAEAFLKHLIRWQMIAFDDQRLSLIAGKGQVPEPGIMHGPGAIAENDPGSADILIRYAFAC